MSIRHILKKWQLHGAIPREALSRFLNRISVDRKCWSWRPPLTKSGYGQIRISGKLQYSHRVSYVLARGLIPSGLTIDHLCRNRACVNPDHLEAVSLRTNTLRGESPHAKNARKTHCINGHALTRENTFRTKRPGRACKACHLITCKKYREKRRDADDRDALSRPKPYGTGD